MTRSETMLLADPQPGFSLALKMRPAVDLSDEEFFGLCQVNRDLRFERTAEGDVIVMSPTGSETGRRNLRLGSRLDAWSESDGRGIAFDSSTGFTLPNGAVRSPDAAWILRDRYVNLDVRQRMRFAAICPDFVIELRSPTDRLEPLQLKLQEYLENGLRLGWLIDPEQRQVWVYRPNQPAVLLDQVDEVRGDPELPGFRLQLEEIWTTAL